jgi:hypothetical protein
MNNYSIRKYTLHQLPRQRKATRNINANRNDNGELSGFGVYGRFII